MKILRLARVAVIAAVVVSAAPLGTASGACKAFEPRGHRASAWAKAHRDPTPKHGGVFFRSSNRQRYFEGVYLRPGIFKIYLYDEYTQPIQGAFFTGELVVRRPPNGTRVPLRLADDGTLTASVPPPAFPLQFEVRLTVTYSGLPSVSPCDDLFSFDFERFTEEPAP